MGYYDDHDEAGRASRKKNRGGWFVSGLVGAIIGIIIAVILSPYLANQGVIPNNDAAGNGNGNTTAGISKQIKVDVDSQVIDAVKKASPAVVGVINYKNSSVFTQQPEKSALGSGIVYKKDGKYAYVVTNNHVVAGASKVEVNFSNNKKAEAKIMGTDALYDLAVLRIPSDNVQKVATFADSSKLKTGEPAIAIGNPLGFQGTVTKGIISAPKQTIQRTTTGEENQQNSGGQVYYQAQVIQTDAAINPGNSGGALINIDGDVVGINSLKIAEQAVEGIGFAIPINVAKPIIAKLEQGQKIERPYIGVSIQELSQMPASVLQKLQLPNDIGNGLVVIETAPNSPASKAGLKQGDVITSINGKQIKSYIDFSTYLLTKLDVGQKVQLTIYRDGKKQTVDLKLGGKVF